VAVLSGDFGSYTYAVSAEMIADGFAPGQRVLVPFGRQRVTGVVLACDLEPPEGVTLKHVALVLDPWPAGDETWFRFIERTAAYYLNPMGSVLKTALPAQMGNREIAKLKVTDKGREAFGDKLAQEQGSWTEVARALKATRKDVEAWVSEGLFTLAVDRPKELKPRTEKIVTFIQSVDVHARAKVEREILAQVRHHKKLSMRALRGDYKNPALPLKRLVEKGAVSVEEVPLGAEHGGALNIGVDAFQLTQEQETVLDAVAKNDGRPAVLQGVTGSGKTEVYLQLARRTLDAGKTVLMLVPEIGLTPALLGRVRARFGDQVAVLHSGLTPKGRLHEWWRIRNGQARFVVGVRSAVFAPLSDLGLVVVDEEHDDAYKQERGLRYHARDLALLRGHLSKAQVVVGSATPSSESAQRARSGQFLALRMNERATVGVLPEVEIVDLRTTRKEQAQASEEGEGKSSRLRGLSAQQANERTLLTDKLLNALRATVSRGEQAIVLLNRRGFAPWVLCDVCGDAVNCDNCSVTMVWHQRRRTLLCHICGATRPLPDRCPSCGSDECLELLGAGTERIADMLEEEVPGANIARLDRDLSGGMKVAKVIEAMAERKIDILVGTQMVAKGHDFPYVTFVGVLLADQGLRVPDYRGSERTFQLLTQVAGRAGRSERPGRVMIQTFTPDHPSVKLASRHNTDAFLDAELRFRDRAGYPPFKRMALFELKGRDPRAVDQRARELTQAAVRLSPPEVEIMGPAPAGISVIRGESRVHILLKSDDRGLLRKVLRALMAEKLLERREGVRVILDIDPVHFS
jgi:primosomal protein N' (replication factor Y)